MTIVLFCGQCLFCGEVLLVNKSASRRIKFKMIDDYLLISPKEKQIDTVKATDKTELSLVIDCSLVQ